MKRLLLYAAAAVIGLVSAELVSRALIASANFQQRSVRADEVEKELSLLEAQFGDDEKFARALRRNFLSRARLRNELRARAREINDLEKQLPALAPKEAEAAAREFYETHRDLFAQPLRLRAAHLFLAAPAGADAEVARAKQKKIAELSARVSSGENFEKLVAEFSEDEATRAQGGDLEIFSAARMPEDFFARVRELAPGEISPPFQTRLGFHIVRLLARKEAREMDFAESRAEIEMRLTNRRRQNLLAPLKENLRVAPSPPAARETVQRSSGLRLCGFLVTFPGQKWN